MVNTIRQELLEKYIYSLSPLKLGKLSVKDEYKPLTDYNKILNRLYLGNRHAAKDKEFFKTHKIKAVLNCTSDIHNHFKDDHTIEYMRIPVEDNLRESDFNKMTQFLPIMAEFIHKHVDLQKNNILLHCHAGRQRSAAGVVAYLMKHHNMSPKQACKFVLDKRPEAFHFGTSLNFSKSIISFKDIKSI
jgi:protein-tyrosine phosphatase